MARRDRDDYKRDPELLRGTLWLGALGAWALVFGGGRVR